MSERVEGLVAQLHVFGREVETARALVADAIELGASDEEILAARFDGLGPLLVDLVTRPPGDAVPLATFAEQSGLDPEFVRRAWAAFGLPAGSPILRVTPDAAEAVHVVAFLADQLGDDAAFGLARVIGASMANVADALANTMRIGVEVPQRDTGVPYELVARDVSDAARDLLPVLWNAVGAVFRRHLVLVSFQKWAPDDARTAVTRMRTIGFVDLVDSTDVLRRQTVGELAASVDRFEQLVWDVVSRAGGRVVKLIGDEAMFVVDDPVDACEVARSLVDSSPGDVRVGLAHGEIVAFHGDCYGPTVNLAARLVAVAEARTIVVSESVRAETEHRIELEAIDPGPLRGFPDVTSAFVMTVTPQS